MSIIVQKFGGTSVADIERIRHVATLVKREIDAGNQVIVVVSAMSGKTNELVGWAEQVSDLRDEAALKEYDSLVSSGEQVTSGLLALTLQSMGLKARSWLGWQIGFQTCASHSKARIENIKTDILKESLDNGEIAVVAGFQGVTDENRIATLGRGGSDTSAVAIAAAMDAERCDIYTDVDGIYTTDPRLVPKARKLNKVAYEEMLEMASLGAKVLQTRSVEMAMKYGVRVQVLSSFADVEGSLLVDEEEVVERRLVTGVTYSRNETQITLTKVPNTPGLAAQVFQPLTDKDINVDMIVQNISEGGGETDMTFTVSKSDADNAVASIESVKDKLKYKSMLVDKNVAKVSVIGVGMRSHAGLAQKMFQTLAQKNINILVISTSEIKISVLIAEEYTELALRALHTAYGLDAEEER
ncbi:MAG: aspartate kinase [Alphaproteobacteria bacterium CG11_big_fil_rev_8_21_14_0_20_39_49]|nr:MAG: aspartate kinase [Alphaproteobacteria bacterium CG11_big_fil_rev_8_21_14_0_20_39_49]